MPSIRQAKPLTGEGTINFVLTPITNGKSRLFLIDFGSAESRNRISLIAGETAPSQRNLKLEVWGDDGKFFEKSVAFPQFQLGTAFDVELVWSSESHRVAVFVDEEEELLDLQEPQLRFGELGDTIHIGEDIRGQNGIEIDFS